MAYLGVIGYSVAAIAYFVFAAFLIPKLKYRVLAIYLFLVCVANFIWAFDAAFLAQENYASSYLLDLLESIRIVAWLTFLYVVLALGSKNSKANILLKRLSWTFYVLMLVIIGLYIYFFIDHSFFVSSLGVEYRAYVHLILAAVGLFLIEQVIRHINPDQRYGIKFLCLGLGIIFTYDFYMYADALLLQAIDPDIWLARGYIAAMVVPLIAIAAARNSRLTLEFFVSHKFAFHTTALLAGGLYLIAMSIGAYYIKVYGGNWGGFIQLIFLAGAAIVLGLLLFSGHNRAWLRVFLAKHFFSYRYDYRDEWLGIIDKLSVKQEPDELRENALRAIADMVDSPAGQLWLYQELNNYQMMTNWNMSNSDKNQIGAGDAIVMFLHQWQWVIDIDEYEFNREIYKDLVLPEWILALKDAWLIVPLIHQKSHLFGFVILSHSRAKNELNWEIRDLLRTAGQQIAGHLVLLDVNLALASARQFEAFNRLSAFVVHDLKNIVAQLSLIERNAERHRDNPSFFDDVIDTVSNSTKKMNRLLAQLRSEQSIKKNISRIEINPLIERVVAHRGIIEPKPELQLHNEPVFILAERDRFASILEHLIQNAQEATQKEGYVRVKLYTEDHSTVITISDNGSGMDDEFIRNKLYKPFVTTKGNAGMGIGVYEAREFITGLGGTIDVQSEPQVGTTFTLKIPIAKDS